MKGTVGLDMGYPYLETEVEGRPARIIWEQKPLYYGYDLVFCGAEFEGILPRRDFPADPASGRGPLHLRGFSDDPDLVALTKLFLKVMNSGQLQEGMVLEAQA
jgi:hypothetical protein